MPVNMGFDANSDIFLEFNSEENGANIKIEYSPDPLMGVCDLSKIILLINLVTGYRVDKRDIMTYVRKHNLERHFRITVA